MIEVFIHRTALELLVVPIRTHEMREYSIVGYVEQGERKLPDTNEYAFRRTRQPKDLWNPREPTIKRTRIGGVQIRRCRSGFSGGGVASVA